jgi:hypothetical protein
MVEEEEEEEEEEEGGGGGGGEGEGEEGEGGEGGGGGGEGGGGEEEEAEEDSKFLQKFYKFLLEKTASNHRSSYFSRDIEFIKLDFSSCPPHIELHTVVLFSRR